MSDLIYNLIIAKLQILLSFCSYDETTGIFTVPSGGDGLYFVMFFMTTADNAWGVFRLQLNGVGMCDAHANGDGVGGLNGAASCSFVRALSAGETNC